MKKLRALLVILILISLVLLTGLVNARIVRVKNVELGINGLDSRLEGMTIAFVTDLNISNTADAGRCATLIKRLCGSNPDMLIIGGGLTSPAAGEDIAKREEALRVFLSRTSDIRLSCGMYIVYSADDLMIPDSYMSGTGWMILSGGQVKIWRNNTAFALVGCDGAANSRRLSFTDEGTGMCIVIAHDPAVSKFIPYKTDSKGTPYADLILCGKTLGGQISIAGRCLFNESLNREFPDEVTSSLTIPMLVSKGVGTLSVPLRFGSEPTAYIITLTKGDA